MAAQVHEPVWFTHVIVLYIAHFATRNNNDLFYRFPKIEAGGGPETKLA